MKTNLRDRNKKYFDKSLLFLALILIIIGGAAFFIILMMRTDPVTSALQENDTLGILVTVHDSEQNHLYSHVFLFNTTTGKGAIIDIPGNIGTRIPELRKIDRLDLLFDVANIEPFMNRISELIGFKLSFYHVYELNSLIKGVDLVDGIQVFIPNPTEHRIDETIIFIPSGSVVLDGEKALQWLIYGEEGESEIDTINRRQRFTRAFLSRLGEYSFRLDDRLFSQHLNQVVAHNMGRDGFTVFSMLLEKMDKDQMVFQRVLGAIRQVDDQDLLFPHYEGNLLRETVEQTGLSLKKEDLSPLPAQEFLEIEILNGTTRTGLAGRTRQIFESFGYTIDYVGNASRQDYEHTVIIDRVGDGQTAQAIAQIINCTRIESAHLDVFYEEKQFDEPIVDLIEFERDITIILGKDFDGRYCVE